MGRSFRGRGRGGGHLKIRPKVQSHILLTFLFTNVDIILLREGRGIFLNERGAPYSGVDETFTPDAYDRWTTMDKRNKGQSKEEKMLDLA